jgi:glycosyltransferase involved in cell wall biosynthesis
LPVVGSSKGRLAFVTPRYGDEIVGGAETAMAEAARGLAGRGYEVELLTTCASSHVSWTNVHEAGEFADRGVTVRRFRTAAARSRLVASELEARVQRGEHLSTEDELAWVNGRFRVPELYLYLGTHAATYDAIVFAPYLFWTTIYGAAVAPERSIVMPCLHDESYARLGIVRSMLESVAGVWFLTDPEHQLGHRIAPGLPPQHSVVGSGVAVPEHYDPAGFRARHHLTRPFVLATGRREGGKGWPTLLAAFGSAVVGGAMPFDLVTVGSGSADVPEGLRGRVIDLGFLDNDELPNAYAAAEALLQPSTNESFSRSVMESWLAGTPVIANAAGEVVAWQCERSGGGLTYDDELEFAHCLQFLAEAPKAAAALGARGRDYVLEHYGWDTVLDEMERSLEAFRARTA